MIRSVIYHIFFSFIGCVVLLQPMVGQGVQNAASREIPVVSLFKDIDLALVGEFVDERGIIKVHRVVYSSFGSGVQGSHLASYENNLYVAVGLNVDYKAGLASNQAPRVMPSVPYLFLLKHTAKPSGQRVISSKPKLVLPLRATSYQFAEGEHGAIPLVDFSGSEYPKSVDSYIHEMDLAFKLGRRPFPGDFILENSIIGKLETFYGEKNGLVVVDAYLGLLDMMQSVDQERRRRIFDENSSNHVFTQLLSELIQDIQLSVEILPDIQFSTEKFDANDRLLVINESQPNAIISGELREALNQYKLEELSLSQRPLNEVVQEIEALVHRQSDGSLPIFSFSLMEIEFEPNISGEFKGVALGDMLFFIGNLYHIRFDYLKEKKMVMVEAY